MIIVKYGGKELASSSNRKQIYEHLKKIDEPIIMVVSAFKDCPYSTSSLSSLLNGNYTYEMEQSLIILGEIISSLRVGNELLNEGIDAISLNPYEIGIYVNTSSFMEKITSLDDEAISLASKNHHVVVVPGFIGINQNNFLVSLNANGSDLTAIALAKMLHCKKVYLFKDVLGVASIDPHIQQTYKIYDEISYSMLTNIIKHGSNIIQKQAVEMASEEDIEIIVKHFMNNQSGTIIKKSVKTRAIVISHVDNIVYVDGYNNGKIIEYNLNKSNIPIDYVLASNEYLKIVTSYENENIIACAIHDLLLKGELK